MAPTLLSTDGRASNSSTSSKMPQVFVVPPEEDDTPAWCCFDADASNTVLGMLAEESDMSLLDLDIKEYQSFIATSTPKKNDQTRSILDVLDNDDFKGLDDGMSLDAEEIAQELDLTETADVGNDSEVVEVIKVGRYTASVEHFRTSTPPPYPSKSLASRVLKSLRNAGKGSKTKEVILPPIEPPIKTPISRRSSTVFSSPRTTLRSPPSASSFDLVEASSIPPLEGPRYPSSLRNVHHSSSRPRSNTVALDLQRPSPPPRIQTTSNRRHFSMMTLNRIFSSSKTDEVSDDISTSKSRHSSGPSTETSSGRTLSQGQKRLSTDSSALEQGDISFEMKLDSLHFDSLSFDIDRF